MQRSPFTDLSTPHNYWLKYWCLQVLKEMMAAWLFSTDWVRLLFTNGVYTKSAKTVNVFWRIPFIRLSVKPVILDTKIAFRDANFAHRYTYGADNLDRKKVKTRFRIHTLNHKLGFDDKNKGLWRDGKNTILFQLQFLCNNMTVKRIGVSNLVWFK